MNSFSFILRPNLPSEKVLHVVVSDQYSQVISALEKAGIITLTVESCSKVLYPLRNHADMLFSYLGNGCFAVEKGQSLLSSQLKELGFNCLVDKFELSERYPLDIPLNFCLVGENIICNEANTPAVFLKDKTVINVKQGYAKCSCIPVDENSLITDDISIFSSCIKHGLDTLLVSKENIRLDGFDIGFIGGCCGKLSRDIIAFCGDIRKHPDYHQIKSFLRERNVFPVSLFGGDLIDIGSLIPVTQSSEST